MQDICCAGHITLDEIITPQHINYLPGGTSWYFSNAISKMPVDYQLITAVANKEQRYITALQNQGINVVCYPSAHTINFVNSYGENQNNRTQKVLQQADTFTAAQLAIANAKVIHLGPLVANDIPPQLIPALSAKTKVSLDVQGYLRSVQGQDVVPVQWDNAKHILPHVYYLKANEHEQKVLTGCANIRDGAKALATMGVKEVIITLGSEGSLIYCDNIFYAFPAYPPTSVVDATGCGDTYTAGYLYKRTQGATIEEAGKFAAAMATLNIETAGAYSPSKEEVQKVMAMYE